MRVEKYVNDTYHNILHYARKHARIYVPGHYQFLEAHGFLRASLSENCSHLGMDNVCGQLSVYIFAYIYIRIYIRTWVMAALSSTLLHQYYFLSYVFKSSNASLSLLRYLFNFLLTCSGSDLRSSVVVVFKEAFVHSLVRRAKGWNEELPFHFFIILCGWVGWNNHSILTPL